MLNSTAVCSSHVNFGMLDQHLFGDNFVHDCGNIMDDNAANNGRSECIYTDFLSCKACPQPACANAPIPAPIHLPTASLFAPIHVPLVPAPQDLKMNQPTMDRKMVILVLLLAEKCTNLHSQIL